MENLLDIDFDGAAPASAQNEPSAGVSGLAGFAPTPVQAQSPTARTPTATSAPSNNLDDLLGVFDAPPAPVPANGNAGGGGADLLNGLSGLDISGSSTPANNQKKTNEDIMSLF